MENKEQPTGTTPTPAAAAATTSSQPPPAAAQPAAGDDEAARELKKRAHFYHYAKVPYKKGAKFGLIIKAFEKRVFVSKLEPKSLCADQLMVGDHLIDVDGEPVHDREQAKKLMLQRLSKTRKVSFIVERPVSAEARAWAKAAILSSSTRTSSTAPREKAAWAAKAALQRQNALAGQKQPASSEIGSPDPQQKKGSAESRLSMAGVSMGGPVGR
ncbi:PDZ domain-containing protein [Aphelenchoides fujianensis]|nr:PDZ domain-containing protein [Aphelenchoides fujianensis]KAI6242119.1 PDZ domain-containing protein [Aphelenchoides fujianensis]